MGDAFCLHAGREGHILMAKTVLIVEDDRNIADLLRLYLEKEGYTVVIAPDGMRGVEQFRTVHPSLVLLDVMLPGLDGFAVLQRARAAGVRTPVLMLTARAELEDCVRGLDGGADYYLTKPFQTQELLACLRAILRRPGETAQSALCFADLELNLQGARLLCHPAEQAVKLSAKELRLMEYFLREPGRIFSRGLLAEKVWGLESEAEYNNIEVYISFLRKKLAFLGSRTKLKTTRGIGYSLEDENT